MFKFELIELDNVMEALNINKAISWDIIHPEFIKM